jgi:cytochrome bd-type quinol oxidase subunit 2
MMAIVQDKSAPNPRFFSTMFLFAAAVMVVGILAGAVTGGGGPRATSNPPFTPMIWVVSAAYFVWMGFAHKASQLEAEGRVEKWAAASKASLITAALIVPLVLATTISQYAQEIQPTIYSPETWAALPLFGVALFGFLVFLSWYHSDNPAASKRFMLIAALSMTEPALSRLFPPTVPATYFMSAAAWLTIIPLLVWDYKSDGEVHWATKAGAFMWALALYLRYTFWQTDAWQAFARSLFDLVQ